jgi:hypothetical protein
MPCFLDRWVTSQALQGRGNPQYLLLVGEQHSSGEEYKIKLAKANKMKSNSSKEVVVAVKKLRQYKEGLRIAKGIRENIDVVGRKNLDTLGKWHQLGAVIENIKQEIGKRYGTGLVPILATEYGHDEADLHRAAKFARKAPDYASFQKENPGVSDLREAVRLASGKGVEGSKSKRDEPDICSLKVFTKQLNQIEERVGKLAEGYSVLLSRREDVTETMDRLKGIRDMFDTIIRSETQRQGTSTAEASVANSLTAHDQPEVIAYMECTLDGCGRARDLSEASTEEVAVIVKEIVDSESPIHGNDLVERIRVQFKQKRLGKVLREKIKKSMDMAAWEDNIVADSNGFLWSNQEGQCPKIRVRSQAKDLNLGHICDEELHLAVEYVKKMEGETDDTAVARKALNLLGFKKPRKSGCNRLLALMKKSQTDHSSGEMQMR